MSRSYSMPGKNDSGQPTVVANVTTEEARHIAAAKNLNGMLLVPRVSGYDHMTCIRDIEGRYKKVRMHESTDEG